MRCHFYRPYKVYSIERCMYYYSFLACWYTSIAHWRQKRAVFFLYIGVEHAPAGRIVLARLELGASPIAFGNHHRPDFVSHFVCFQRQILPPTPPRMQFSKVVNRNAVAIRNKPFIDCRVVKKKKNEIKSSSCVSFRR